MKSVVWGTGGIAAKFVGTLQNDNIAFFIDSDERKRGTVFMGRQVKMPDEIENWNEIFIYIQYNYFEEIAKLLRKKGLVEEENFSKYLYPKQIQIEDIDIDCDNVFCIIKSKKAEMEKRDWYWGAMLAYNQTTFKNYFEVLQRSLNETFLTISREVYISQNEAESSWQMPVLILPKIFGADAFQIISDKKDEIDYGILLEKTYPELLDISMEYIGIYKDLDKNQAYMYTYKQASFIDKMVRILCPKRVFIMGSFHTPHRVLAILCHKHHTPVIYTHPGALPKTWSFEVGGEMGESLPAVYAKEFLQLPVDVKEIAEAKNVWMYLKGNRINRKIQPKTDWCKEISSRIKNNRPVILYAGQNDVLSGMAYYGDNAKTYHSPVFPSSTDVIPFLAELAQKNDWNLIYKPHPIYLPTKEQLDAFPENVLYVEMADINDIIDFSSVTITILSSAAYVALIREKPVVMLGYNQLKEKGCTYEAFTKDIIEEVIKQALDDGFTKIQREAFTKHIAQLLKYYLYMDLDDGTKSFGRPIPKDFKEFYELSELLCVKNRI